MVLPSLHLKIRIDKPNESNLWCLEIQCTVVDEIVFPVILVCSMYRFHLHRVHLEGQDMLVFAATSCLNPVDLQTACVNLVPVMEMEVTDNVAVVLLRRENVQERVHKERVV